MRLLGVVGIVFACGFVQDEVSLARWVWCQGGAAEIAILQPSGNGPSIVNLVPTPAGGVVKGAAMNAVIGGAPPLRRGRWMNALPKGAKPWAATGSYPDGGGDWMYILYSASGLGGSAPIVRAAHLDCAEMLGGTVDGKAVTFMDLSETHPLVHAGQLFVTGSTDAPPGGEAGTFVWVARIVESTLAESSPADEVARVDLRNAVIVAKATRPVPLNIDDGVLLAVRANDETASFYHSSDLVDWKVSASYPSGQLTLGHQYSAAERDGDVWIASIEGDGKLAVWRCSAGGSWVKASLPSSTPSLSVETPMWLVNNDGQIELIYLSTDSSLGKLHL